MKIKNIINQFIVTSILFVSLVFNVYANDTNNPYDVTKVTANKVFEKIKSQKLKVSTDKEALREIVINDIEPYVHIKYSGALILGSYYQKATPAQRDSFFNAFEKLLVNTAVELIGLYTDETVQVEPAKNVEKKTLVNVTVKLISQARAPISLDFKWRKNTKTNSWQIYDIASEGISIVDTKRNEWAQILKSKGIDYLTSEINKLSTQPLKLDK